MLIGIDGRLANETQRAGVGNYSTGVLEALSRLETDNLRFRIYLDAPPREGFPVASDAAEFVVLPRARFWTHRVLAAALREAPPDVFYAPVMERPHACPCPVVATVHDLAFFPFGAHFPFRKRWVLRWQARHTVRRAAHLLADSLATRRDIEQRLHVPAERVTVAYAGCDGAFSETQSADSIAAVRARYRLPGRYLLYVGQLQPRKNLVRLVEAFEQVCARHPGLPHHLVLAGGAGWLAEPLLKRIRKAGLGERIHVTGFVDEAELPALMQGADVLTLVSLWEGFGLPVLEAMAGGTAVLASNCSSLPEVVGEAGLLVDPMDIEAIAAGLERLLTDDAYRARTAAKGPRQAARFTWEATAHLVVSALQRAAGRSAD